jgi:D-alanyl-D-alanine carboxypeptidase (penicillin-binding protein 5/6)
VKSTTSSATASELLDPADGIPADVAARLIAGQVSYLLPAGGGHHGYVWQNANPLIGACPGATGIKTGDTKPAGNCLLFAATRNGLTLIGATLGTPGDDITVTGPVAARVLNRGFSHF